MRSFPKLLALFLIGLFLAFSFNAYACVVPVFAKMPVAQVSDCTMPGEEPVTQFCDGFKTLAVQSSLDTPSNSQAHAPFIGEMALLLPDLVPSSRTFIFPPGTGQVAVPKDLLLLISVFRI
ncbi:MAG: hypothetical protein H6750_05905 [Nitrospiraceae bacterium]|nr:hypothetical protein [Nitrospira sp.]MCB9773844.1 hypothetical protein [Nitrospiraceae bacterium]